MFQYKIKYFLKKISNYFLMYLWEDTLLLFEREKGKILRWPFRTSRVAQTVKRLPTMQET